MSDTLKIYTLTLGLLQTNCYIAVDDRAKKGVVIDPADDGDYIVQFIRNHHLEVHQILLTHGHFDHVGGIGTIKNELGAEIWIHEKDAPMLENPGQNLSFLMEGGGLSHRADGFLEEGQSIEYGSGQLKVIHTPGHTPGGVSFIGDHFVFVGDTLFRNSVGRSDFPYSSGTQLIESIQKKLYILDDDFIVYPGHGPETTIGRERSKNPFVSQDRSSV